MKFLTWTHGGNKSLNMYHTMKLYIYILVGAQSVEYWELAYRTWLQLHVPANWHVSKATRSIDPELGDSNHLARNGDGCNALQWHVLQWSKDRVPAWFIPGNGAGFWFWLIRKGPKKNRSTVTWPECVSFSLLASAFQCHRYLHPSA